MNEPRAFRLLVTAAFKDGSFLYTDRNLMGLVEVQESSGGAFSNVVIRLAIPRKDAEVFVNGLLKGLAELLVEGIPSQVESASIVPGVNDKEKERLS